MADTAILNQTAHLLAGVSAKLPADAALRAFFSENRRLTSAVRGRIARALFSYFRWREWLNPADPWQKKVAVALSFQEKFEAKPESIKAEALRARAIPAWLAAEVDLPIETLRLWQREPALWLRARPGQTAELAKELNDCVKVDAKLFGPLDLKVAAPGDLTALRYTGTRDLFTTTAFHAGRFEIQDLASQLVGYACAPQPGETWWDACAGEGGKTLHLGDLMGGKGLIWASDRSNRRLETLKRRASRAKLFNYRTALWDGTAKLPTKTKFDGVLLDAPCSGVGTWQRNPHARWTAKPDDVRELTEVQAQMLNAAATALKPCGRLVYAVCTLTRGETTAIADAFSAGHPEFEPVPVFGKWNEKARIGGHASGDGARGALNSAIQETDTFADTQLTVWPHVLNANGMFIAVWRKKG